MGRETLKQECYAESVILSYLNRNILRVKSITLDLNRSDSWSTHSRGRRVGVVVGLDAGRIDRTCKARSIASIWSVDRGDESSPPSLTTLMQSARALSRVCARACVAILGRQTAARVVRAVGEPETRVPKR